MASSTGRAGQPPRGGTRALRPQSLAHLLCILSVSASLCALLDSPCRPLTSVRKHRSPSVTQFSSTVLTTWRNLVATSQLQWPVLSKDHLIGSAWIRWPPSVQSAVAKGGLRAVMVKGRYLQWCLGQPSSVAPPRKASRVA